MAAMSDDSRPEKPISASRVRLSQLMLPEHANLHGNVHGGVIARLVDEAGALAAMRHAGRPVVTVAIDSMTFLKPIVISNLVILNAELTCAGRSSMEARVEVEAEDILKGTHTSTNTAYLVYVAIDDDGRPCPVPALRAENEEERQRMERARARQELRLRQRRLEEQTS
jgi:uncharacterized protein (TIGR00369 family)